MFNSRLVLLLLLNLFFNCIECAFLMFHKGQAFQMILNDYQFLSLNCFSGIYAEIKDGKNVLRLVKVDLNNSSKRQALEFDPKDDKFYDSNSLLNLCQSNSSDRFVGALIKRQRKRLLERLSPLVLLERIAGNCGIDLVLIEKTEIDYKVNVVDTFSIGSAWGQNSLLHFTQDDRFLILLNYALDQVRIFDTQTRDQVLLIKNIQNIIQITSTNSRLLCIKKLLADGKHLLQLEQLDSKGTSCLPLMDILTNDLRYLRCKFNPITSTFLLGALLPRKSSSIIDFMIIDTDSCKMVTKGSFSLTTPKKYMLAGEIIQQRDDSNFYALIWTSTGFVECHQLTGTSALFDNKVISFQLINRPKHSKKSVLLGKFAWNRTMQCLSLIIYEKCGKFSGKLKYALSLNIRISKNNNNHGGCYNNKDGKVVLSKRLKKKDDTDLLIEELAKSLTIPQVLLEIIASYVVEQMVEQIIIGQACSIEDLFTFQNDAYVITNNPQLQRTLQKWSIDTLISPKLLDEWPFEWKQMMLDLDCKGRLIQEQELLWMSCNSTNSKDKVNKMTKSLVLPKGTTARIFDCLLNGPCLMIASYDAYYKQISVYQFNGKNNVLLFRQKLDNHLECSILRLFRSSSYRQLVLLFVVTDNKKHGNSGVIVQIDERDRSMQRHFPLNLLPNSLLLDVYVQCDFVIDPTRMEIRSITQNGQFNIFKWESRREESVEMKLIASRSLEDIHLTRARFTDNGDYLVIHNQRFWSIVCI